MKVDYPLNIDNDDITTSGELRDLPLSVPTSTSYFIHRIQLAELYREAVDTLPSIVLESPLKIGSGVYRNFNMTLRETAQYDNDDVSRIIIMQKQPDGTEKPAITVEEKDKSVWLRLFTHTGARVYKFYTQLWSCYDDSATSTAQSEHCPSPNSATFKDNTVIDATSSKATIIEQQKMYTQAEEELTVELLTELLAFQFCSPVQWIDTQDILLAGNRAAGRIVEIGPSSTLVDMAKKTLSKSSRLPVANRVQGQQELLSHLKHSDAIYYRSHEAEPDDGGDVAAPSSVQTPVPGPAPTPVPDVPLKALDVLLAIVSLSLKKSPHQISPSEPLKQLCGGRSTLQNEIIGDLVAEFSVLPEQAEQLSLEELAGGVNLKNDSIGPYTTARISKFVSAKLPSNSRVSGLRRDMKERWGLGAGMQDRVLLAALVQQAPNRIADDIQARSFVDSLVTEVSKSMGMDMSTASVASGQEASGAATAVPTELLLATERKNAVFDGKLMELYAEKCNREVGPSPKTIESLQEMIASLQGDLDMWLSEHGQYYSENMRPKFNTLKARSYDSSWNWIVQDLLMMLTDMAKDNRVTGVDMESALLLQARTTPRLLEVISYLMSHMPKFESDSKTILLDVLTKLNEVAANGLALAPSFQGSALAVKAIATSDKKGLIPVNGEEEVKPEHSNSSSSSVTWDLVTEQSSLSSTSSAVNVSDGGQSVGGELDGMLSGQSTPPSDNSAYPTPDPFELAAYNFNHSSGVTDTYQPRKWQRNEALTKAFLGSVKQSVSEGMSFQNKTVLVTGAGKGSIAAELVKLLLSGGAKVLVTTSSYDTSVGMWEQIYSQRGARGSQLNVVPFNGASQQDIQSLVSYLYDQLAWDLNYIVPFAAMGETGRTIDNIDSKSEIAHRAMLVNVIRMLGAVKTCKEKKSLRSNPTRVILPLSPNHGLMGNDGLYAESKLGLEALLNKFSLEDWSDYLSVCRAIIGWTRGTGLMAANDVVAATLEEEHSLRTFATEEMATYIACLMADEAVHRCCEMQPVVADISGNMASQQNLKGIILKIRRDADLQKDTETTIAKEDALVGNGLRNTQPEHRQKPSKPLSRRPIVSLDSFSLPNYEKDIQPFAQMLNGLVDLDRVPVIVGFGEIGPYGNSRTRWQIEVDGTFSVQGCLEMAWMMGLVKYHNGPLQYDGKSQHYCGWVETSCSKPITGMEIKAKYEEQILSSSGIRIIEPRGHDQTEDASRQQLMHEHGDKVKVFVSEEQTFAKLMTGATLMVPKREGSGRMGPKLYGISEDIVAQVDPVTLFTIVSTVEALLSAGLTDPFELYRHVHVSDVSVCIGSGLGGTTSLRNMFKERFKDRIPVQKDVLAETFINTTGAWINMLLLGASGPIRTPVGACATALESVDTGVDMITSGRAKVCLVGGFDALELDVTTEFGNMQATVDAGKEAAMGRSPRRYVSPTAASRSGFVEAEGSGVQLMTTARLALDMGMPIHAIVALSHTASDTIGRSVPAPGKELLTIVKEARLGASNAAKTRPEVLDIEYRRSRLERRKRQIADGLNIEVAEDVASPNAEALAKAEAAAALKQAQWMYGNAFYKDDARISPLQGALAVWGLTVDDIGFASMHGTSTVKNDLNEASVLQKQLTLLDRSKGNVMPCVCQKWLTEHAKGAAGGFALNGCIQTISTGIVPGNRNADNIDAGLETSDLLLFPRQNLDLGALRAGPIDAFSVIGVHPRRLFAVIGRAEYEDYSARVVERRRRAGRYFQDGLCGGKLVQRKDKGVYAEGGMEGFFVTADARVA
ncbi:fatty acid synthase alpha subunit FasA [Apiospora phragmitis]|uniref:beta-ketoacyl-[acyl-carrier-protein] synthase I n=1 Tax=Apiospora phragmitis TaxID=2905665 RepID=A0ABR1VDT3_9PEZI